MQNEPIEDDPVAEDNEDHRTQQMVLGIVTDTEQRPWSVEEIMRVLDGRKQLAVEDAIGQLQMVGLLNRVDGMVFASQAAAHVDRLHMLSI